MFTGIITAIGRIETVTPLGDPHAGVRLTIVIDAGTKFDQVMCGDSIAVQGPCLTVVATDIAEAAPQSARLTVEVSRASLNCTVGLDALGEVNLESALRVGEPLGGHLVAGHIDGIGTVTHLAPVNESHELRILAPPTMGHMLARKGSVAVNGVSLTINAVEDGAHGCECSINLIPYTVENTTLKYLKVGEQVNLEVDWIARYVERILKSVPAAPNRLNPSSNLNL